MADEGVEDYFGNETLEEIDAECEEPNSNTERSTRTWKANFASWAKVKNCEFRTIEDVPRARVQDVLKVWIRQTRTKEGKRFKTLVYNTALTSLVRAWNDSHRDETPIDVASKAAAHGEFQMLIQAKEQAVLKAYEAGEISQGSRALTSDELDRLHSVPDIHTPEGLNEAIYLCVCFSSACRISEIHELPYTLFSNTNKKTTPDGREYFALPAAPLKNLNGHALARNTIDELEHKLFIIKDNGITRNLAALLEIQAKRRPVGVIDRLFLRPLPTYQNKLVWYAKQAKGKGNLSKMLASICERAGVDKELVKSHTARKTAATLMFRAGADDREVRSVTKHAKGSRALDTYKKVQPDHADHLSRVAQGLVHTPFSAANAAKQSGAMPQPIGFSPAAPVGLLSAAAPASGYPSPDFMQLMFQQTLVQQQMQQQMFQLFMQQQQMQQMQQQQPFPFTPEQMRPLLSAAETIERSNRAGKDPFEVKLDCSEDSQPEPQLEPPKKRARAASPKAAPKVKPSPKKRALKRKHN